MLEYPEGFVASRAGGWAIIVPGRVGLEVAFPRPGLVLSSCVKLVETDEWVGFKRGLVWVSCRVWRPDFPLLHE